MFINKKCYDMKDFKHKEPVFFSSLLFDFLGIHGAARLTMKSKVEYLRMTYEEIKWRYRNATICKEGLFLEEFQYIQFCLNDEIFLFLFDVDNICFRAYSYKDILLN